MSAWNVNQKESWRKDTICVIVKYICTCTVFVRYVKKSCCENFTKIASASA